MLTAKLILDTRRRSQKGYPYKINLSGDGKRKLISTGFYAEAELTPRHPEYRNLKRYELEIIEQVAFCNAHKFTLSEAVSYIKENADPETEIELLKKRIRELESGSGAMLFEFWKEFTKERVQSGRSGVPFDRALEQLKNYSEDIPLSAVNYEWIKGFVSYKYRTGCGDAGLSYYLRSFRTVFLEAQRRESLGVKPGNPFKGLIPSSTPEEPVQLTREELKRIKEYEPRPGTTHKNASEVRRRRDIFLFQFYIGGHDYADIARLKWSDLKRGRVQFSRYKQRNKGGAKIDNLLTPEALEIIERHGTRESKRVFSFIPDPDHRTSYENYRNNTNRTLKKISRDLELTSVMKTKSTRYIFRTWAGELGENILAIMQIQGHKARGITFSYQGRLPQKITDKTLKNVIQ